MVFMNLKLWNNKVSKFDKPVVVEFWAKWCGPCKVMAPSLEQMKGEFNGKVDLIKIDADTESKLMQELKIYSIPTLLIYNRGALIARKTGAMGVDQLRNLFIMAETGQNGSVKITSTDRIIRLAAGTLFIAASFLTGFTIPFLLLGGIVLFSAIYDRCPIWKFVSSRISSLFHRTSAKANSE
jgi:thioredoxin